jgi:hypothetical protein
LARLVGLPHLSGQPLGIARAWLGQNPGLSSCCWVTNNLDALHPLAARLADRLCGALVLRGSQSSRSTLLGRRNVSRLAVGLRTSLLLVLLAVVRVVRSR